ncbi:MAG: hypothetical protein WA001_04835 [Patescibacteria group bacterium]
MVRDIFERVDIKWLGSIKSVQLGWNPSHQTLTLWMQMRSVPPPYWLRQLTVALTHDDGRTTVLCRLGWTEFNRELLSPRIIATREQLAPFVNPAIVPCVPVLQVVLTRGKRSRRLPNESSYKLRNGGTMPPDSSS